MVTTGFTFRGIHSSQFNIICDPQSLQLLPARRRYLTTVPGRSGSHVHDDGTYEDREGKFTCYYTKKADSNISLQAREIAAWLAEEGLLFFDNEPDKYYQGYYSGAPILKKHLKYGEFSLAFTFSPPFAFTEQRSVVQNIRANEGSIIIPAIGTAPMPCRIIIRNVGQTTINNLRISHKLL